MLISDGPVSSASTARASDNDSTLIEEEHTLIAAISPAFLHPRESSDNPRLNAFCRVAPSLRLRLLATFFADVLFRAADFNSRTSALVQGRRFEFFLAIYGSPVQKHAAYSLVRL
jgi:hypothetical protein